MNIYPQDVFLAGHFGKADLASEQLGFIHLVRGRYMNSLTHITLANIRRLISGKAVFFLLGDECWQDDNIVASLA